jgi:hypothetical protein
MIWGNLQLLFGQSTNAIEHLLNVALCILLRLNSGMSVVRGFKGAGILRIGGELLFKLAF